MSEFTLPLEMIKTYLHRRSEEVPILKKSLESSSVEEFNRVGHKLLGNARTYGFVTLEPLAERMNSLTQEQIAKDGPALVAEYESWIQVAKTKVSELD